MDVSLYGKLPAEADFFRHGQTGTGAREVENWLSESCEALRGAGMSYPESPVCCVYARPGWREVVVVLTVASRDAVGRSFPLGVFASIDAAVVAGRGWLLPMACGAFFGGAHAALTRAVSGGTVNEIVAEVERLPPIDAATMQWAEGAYEELIAGKKVGEFESRVFDPVDGRFYAYRTLRMACDAVQSVPDQAGTVLGCPVSVDVDLVTWCSLVARVLGWTSTVPFMWLSEPTPRLLISLGPPPPQSFQFLVDPSTDSMRYWPLTTNHAGAIAQARDALKVVAGWDSGTEPLSGLFDRVVSLG